MLQNLIARSLRIFGYKMNKISAKTDVNVQLIKSLEHVGVTLVFDVGANVGQFAKGLRSAGYKGHIVSFEPLRKAHATLSTHARNDSKWIIHSRTAIGNTEGSIDINIAGNSVSSSILPMLELHSRVEKGSRYVDVESTEITRLDNVTSEYISPSDSYFIKIDTQGFEWEVLDGGLESIRHAAGILIEASLAPLYQGSHLWMDILTRLEATGFALWSLQPNFVDLRTGQSLQIDMIFLKKNKI